jgi:hypothetical protein
MIGLFSLELLARAATTPVGPAVLTRPRADFDEDIELARDDADADYSGWYCVSTDPFPCPAEGCSFVATHMTAAHLIVVWPSSDDRDLLTYARDAQRVDRNPRIVEYERALGPCIPYDVWVGLGKPIHGALDKPAGWDANRNRL